MENRSVYRRVEEAALLGLFERGDHYHSLLSERLRHRYREYRDLREMDMARLVAVASLYGNHKTDISAGNKFVKDTLGEVRSRVPYMIGKKRRAGDSRQDAVSHYLRVMEEYQKIVDSRSKK